MRCVPAKCCQMVEESECLRIEMGKKKSVWCSVTYAQRRRGIERTGVRVRTIGVHRNGPTLPVSVARRGEGRCGCGDEGKIP
jgi:hypothetical protein